jgi:hypothetical protein
MRVHFLAGWKTNFDADEALVAIQAQEILHGRFSLFLPRQAYMGSLQSLVAAPLVAIFGAHPTSVRLSPLLWLLPGLLALLSLERRGGGPLAAGRGARALSVAWLFPPAVLFLAGLKARGGNLEGLVLGLWAVALIWPGRRARTSRLWMWGLAGLLLGLGCWTHDQTIFFLPLMLPALIVAGRTVWSRAAAAALGGWLGYLPCWLPKVVPFGLGPPGTMGADLRVAPLASFSVPGMTHLLEIVPAALTTRAQIAAAAPLASLAWVLYLLVMIGCLAVLVRPGSALRRSLRADAGTPKWMFSPALTVTAWIAAANVGALLLSPDYFGDGQWFRYTLAVAPFLVVIFALALTYSRPRLAIPLAGLMIVASAAASWTATPGWVMPHAEDRSALVEELERRGIRRVETDWQLAYALRFFSGGRILASSRTPVRFSEVNAAVDFAPEAYYVRVKPAERLAPDDTSTNSAGSAFRIRPRVINPPPEVADAFARLDPFRTLYAADEPFPLLDQHEVRRDWKGWPYRRPLSCFDAVLWDPRPDAFQKIEAARIEQSLQQLVASGQFEVAAEWSGRRILTRARPARAPAPPRVATQGGSS